MRSESIQPRFLLGTVGHNQHIANIARALDEANALAAFHTTGMDLANSIWGRGLQTGLKAVFPGLNAKLARRRIEGVNPDLIRNTWAWEGVRLATRCARLGVESVDRVWEQGELAFDRRCARLVRDDTFNAFFGVEHGALAALRSAREAGKRSVLAFLSPHHATRLKWVDPVYKQFPELLTPEVRRIRELAKSRDARRDEEAQTASVIHCASRFTARSLISAGLVAPHQMTIVPLGCLPIPKHGAGVTSPAASPFRFVWSGGVSVHKGIHVLLDAWRRLRPGKNAELHVYGSVLVPERVLNTASNNSTVSNNIVFHGPVNSHEMTLAYQQAHALVFPTLCDGFGMVVSEAFSVGLPVITTHNAGAADLVQEGWNGFVLPPADAARLAERLQWCLDNPTELNSMRANALRTAQEWGWADFRNTMREQLAHRLGMAFPVTTSIQASQAWPHAALN